MGVCYLLSLLDVEVADRAMVREQVSTFQKLCHEIDVPLILHEAIVFKLWAYVRNLMLNNGCLVRRKRALLTTKGCCIFSRMLFSFSM